jgi:hypothetical protein
VEEEENSKRKMKIRAGRQQKERSTLNFICLNLSKYTIESYFLIKFHVLRGLDEQSPC